MLSNKRWYLNNLYVGIETPADLTEDLDGAPGREDAQNGSRLM